MATTTLQDIINRIDLLTKAVLANKEIMTTEDAAAYTGLSVSGIYKLTSNQQIPHYKPRGKMMYFNRSELDEWMLQNKIKTVDEISKTANDLIVKSY